jgi:GNAT superfamily N-acetyltransferase
MNMDPEPRTVVAPVDPHHLPAAALVAASGMRDNPLHVAAVGDDPQRRIDLMRRAFETVLQFDGRCVLGAWQDDRLVGVAAYTAVDRCRPTVRERLALLPVVARAGPRARKILRWQRTWALHDPDPPHSHLGPVAVDLEHQGHGIGSRLLAAYVSTLDETGTVGYLETDKRANVGFYERFGFTVAAEANVIGVTNWFMTREP